MVKEKPLRSTLTTGQVAKICEVAPRTACAWVDKGLLIGFRLPGSRDRRIPRESLLAFLRENGMDIHIPPNATDRRVLLIGCDPSLSERLRGLLPDDFQWQSAASVFEAGVQAERLRPDTVVIDLAMGRGESMSIAHCLRRMNAGVTLIALACEDEVAFDELRETGFCEHLCKPFDPALLAERLESGEP